MSVFSRTAAERMSWLFTSWLFLWCFLPVERVQAMFTIMRSFGCVSSQYSDASSRFAMVFSLDFNHAGQAAAGHLQVHATQSHTHASRWLLIWSVCVCASLSFRLWCWTNGKCVSKQLEKATSWSSLRCWQDSALRWGNSHCNKVDINILCSPTCRMHLKYTKVGKIFDLLFVIFLLTKKQFLILWQFQFNGDRIPDDYLEK